ncbi:MAG: guanylate kinase [Pirellulales bacterium]
MPDGRLIMISGPSGVGKTTLVKKLFERCPGPLVASVSATTRPPRPGEVDGRDYHFLSQQEFDELRQRGEFLECFEVYNSGHWYGTLRREVDEGLKAGKWVILSIDVQGTLTVLKEYPGATTIFVRPACVEELERRLRGRGTDSEAAMARRLQNARRELELASRYQHQVINEDLDQAVQEVCDLLTRTGNGSK